MKQLPIKHAFTLLLLVSTTVLGIDAVAAERNTSPAEIATRFAADLATGNEAEIRKILAENVLIYESGGVESSLEEYAGHHLPADMKFMSGVQREVLSLKTFELGEAAVVATQTRLHGSYSGKAIDRTSTETLVLKRINGAWKIVHIHWSSR